MDQTQASSDIQGYVWNPKLAASLLLSGEILATRESQHHSSVRIHNVGRVARPSQTVHVSAGEGADANDRARIAACRQH